MAAPLDDEGREKSSDASTQRARQWWRALLALAVLFASMPLMSKLLLGSWAFDDALGIACLLSAAAAYLYFAGRKHRTVPDAAAMLEEAIQQAASGHIEKGLAILDDVLRQ